MDFSHLKVSFKQVFRNPSYAAASVLTAASVLFLAVSFRNFSLIGYVIKNNLAGLPILTISLFQSLTTNFTPLQAAATVVISVLFGINISMLAYSMRNSRNGAGVKRGGFGLLAGAFGIGCASCGSFLLSSILAFFGAAGAIALLPLRGVELAFVGMLLMVVSIYAASKNINAHCKIVK